MREAQKNSLLALASVVLALLLAEAAVRIALPAPGFFPVKSPPGLLIPHSERGYAYAPGFRGRVVTADYDIRVETNSRGLRDDESDLGAPLDILAIGDSFTVGFGVEASEAWPSRLEAHLNAAAGDRPSLRVLNGAVSGYSIIQIQLLLAELLELDPGLVILGLYPPGSGRIANPFVLYGGEAVQQGQVPRLKIVDGGFILTPVYRRNLQPLYFWCAQYFHAGAYALDGIRQVREWIERRRTGDAAASRPYVTGADLQLLLAGVESIWDLLADHGIPLVVLIADNQEADGSFAERKLHNNRIITAYCEERGIPVMDPMPALERAASGRPIHRIGSDHHWSAGAHEIVSKELGDFLIGAKLIRAPGAGSSRPEPVSVGEN